MRPSHASMKARSALRTALAIVLLAAAPQARQSARPAQYLDTYVDADRASGEWAIGNNSSRYTFVANRDGTVNVGGLAVAGSFDPVTMGAEPDALVTIGGETLRLGGADGDFRVQSVEPSTGPHFVSLAIR